MKYLLWLAFFFSIQNLALASINPPVAGNGVETFVCDVRSSNDEYASSGTLRERLDLFNAEADITGGTTHEGNCLHYIYFLDPMTITLKYPLDIKAIQSPTTDGKHMIGTYISGKNTDGKLLPVIIDAVKLTTKAKNCAFMIERGVIYNANKTIKYEGGLASFQQIRNMTVRVSSADRSVCDDKGHDLMNEVIPTGSARDPIKCPKGTLAKNCDFKNLEVIVDTSLLDQDGDKILDDKDNCPELANKDQTDLDDDGKGDVCDSDADDDDIFGDYDLCPLVKDNDGFGFNIDTDEDALADLCADDFLEDKDNDGFKDKVDLCPAKLIIQTGTGLAGQTGASPTPGLSQCPKLRQDEDMDKDGIGDACDNNIDGDNLINKKDPAPCSRDSDGDGIPDGEDECPLDADHSAPPCETQDNSVTDEENNSDNDTDLDSGNVDDPEGQEGETEATDNETDDDNDGNDNATEDNETGGASLGGGCRLEKNARPAHKLAWVYWLLCGILTLTLIRKEKKYE